MLKYWLLAFGLVYVVALGWVIWCKKSLPKSIYLVISAEVLPEQLEWLVYCFRRYLQKSAIDYEWYIYVEPGKYAIAQKKNLQYLNRRFSFQIQESADFEGLIYIAAPDGSFVKQNMRQTVQKISLQKVKKPL